MKKIIFLSAILTTVLSGCMKEVDLDTSQDKSNQGREVVFSGVFKPNIDTRTTVGNTSGDVIPVLWTEGDNVGVFSLDPATTTANAKASLLAGAGRRIGQFSALNVVMVDRGNEFYTYYPYEANALGAATPNTKCQIKYSNSGAGSYLFGVLPTNQEQVGPNNYSHFSHYGVAVGKTGVVAADETPVFTMNHVLTYIELGFWSSDAELANWSVSQINILAPGSHKLAGPFVGTFADGKGEAMSGMADTYFTNSIELNIDNPEKVPTSLATAHKFLATLLPVDLTGEKLQIVVKVSKQVNGEDISRFYGANITAKELKYDWLNRIATADLSQWEKIYPLKAAVIWEEGVTLSNVSLTAGVAATDLSGVQANSFIIREAGQYSFPAKTGAGTWVAGVDPSLESNVTFTVPAGASGNALIGIYRWNPEQPDGTDNTIMYSWHIWLSDPQDVAVGTTTYLDRDLGATSATVGDPLTAGYYYQWGRKDPFARAIMSGLTSTYLGPESNAFGDQRTLAVLMNTTTFGPDLQWTLVRSKQTYSDTYNNPTSFIDGMKIGDGIFSSILTEGHVNMPSYSTAGLTNWAAHANPCPFGYHVPTVSQINSLPGTITNATSLEGASVSGLWFEFTDYRNNEFGNFRALGGSNLSWTDETNIYQGVYGKYGNSFNVKTGGLSKNGLGRISSGRTVRCVKN